MPVEEPARSPADAENRPAVLNYHEPATEDDAAPARRPAHVGLTAVAAIYLVINVGLVALSFTGANPQPWGVLGCFSVWAPLLLAVGLVVIQTTSRPFHWGAVLIFLGVIAAAAVVNLMVLFRASASV